MSVSVQVMFVPVGQHLSCKPTDRSSFWVIIDHRQRVEAPGLTAFSLRGIGVSERLRDKQRAAAPGTGAGTGAGTDRTGPQNRRQNLNRTGAETMETRSAR